MPKSIADKRAAFRSLHESACFVIPNPWDVGSAIMLQQLGFKALASTSAGMAWTMGRPDNGVTRDDVLAHLRDLVEAVDVPVNADYENAFADDPDGVATNIALAADTGIAGVSIEDSTGNPDAPLYEFELAVARVAAARAAIDRTGSGVLLTARSEGFIAGRPDLEETVRRLKAFAAAGADCLYAPGIRDDAQITAVLQAAAAKPVNVLTPGRPVAELAALGVRRISVGGALARAAYGEFLRAAREIADQGAFTAFERAAPSRELNGFFADRKENRG